MNGTPVFGDLDAPGQPHPIMRLHVVEEALRRRDPRRAAGQPTVQTNGQHLGAAVGALGVEHVERVAKVRQKSSPLENPAGEANRMSLVSSAYGTTRWSASCTRTQ
ncbi:hypothetical protein MSIMFI_01993 [Mycobacterium simulans]|nr:hypothetical protein MSIMFI_01993 [Mycobacterium simulans]